MTSNSSNLDVLVVGAGFAGIYQLYQLRERGYSTKIIEAGSGLGGTWHWNRYPGARVDSDMPIYQFSMTDLWKDWTWSESFPGWKELQAYFRYVDSKLDISRDVQFNTRVVAARFDTKTNRWVVTTDSGQTLSSRFLSLCTGALTTPYIPNLPGLDTFKGIVHHTSRWPEEGVDVRGKRVGIIGTGASGVQVIQEIGPLVEHLTVFQRTPNYSLPMRQRKLDAGPQAASKKDGLYPITLNRRDQTFAGFHYDFFNKRTFDATPEERRLFYEEIWAQGGFHFWLGTYIDMLTDQKANDEAYAFWRDKVRARINDSSLHEKLAPTKPIHPFGTKRPCLEQSYFEVYNQPNVTLVDVNECAITEITPKGIRTSDGEEREFDILILATGFDPVTGAIANIDIVGTDGISIRDKWSKGLRTYLGMTTANFPNMFFTYGPHGPTGFCNGPTCAESQGNWVINCIEHMKAAGLERIEAQDAKEEEWSKLVNDTCAKGLWTRAKSWYTGANIPGRLIEGLMWTGGVPLYNQLCKECVEEGYKGFTFSGGDAKSATP